MIPTLLTATTGGMTVAQIGLNTAMLANPIGIVIGLIGALIAIGTALVMNWDDISDAGEALWKWLKDGFMGLKDFLVDFLKFGSELGKMFLEGFLFGFLNFFPDTKQAIKDAFFSVVDDAKEALGINSPSKVMMAIGADTAEGFNVGFEDEALKLDRSIQASVDGIGRGIANGTTTSNRSNVNNIYVQNPTISNNMDVNRMTDKIADKCTRAGVF